jgi:DNA-binding NtrC family response regulator
MENVTRLTHDERLSTQIATGLLNVVSSKRILVVDDDPHVREMLVQRLRSRGFAADSSDDASGALKTLSTRAYDVLLLDLIMPRECGTVLLDKLIANANPTRCIVMSGVADLWRKANPTKPVAGVLQKPFLFEDLLHLIDNA